MRFQGIFASSDTKFTTFLIVNDKSTIPKLFYIVYNKDARYYKDAKIFMGHKELSVLCQTPTTKETATMRVLAFLNNILSII